MFFLLFFYYIYYFPLFVDCASIFVLYIYFHFFPICFSLFFFSFFPECSRFFLWHFIETSTPGRLCEVYTHLFFNLLPLLKQQKKHNQLLELACSRPTPTTAFHSATSHAQSSGALMCRSGCDSASKLGESQQVVEHL